LQINKHLVGDVGIGGSGGYWFVGGEAWGSSDEMADVFLAARGGGGRGPGARWWLSVTMANLARVEGKMG
jgi:hypothetical protein